MAGKLKLALLVVAGTLIGLIAAEGAARLFFPASEGPYIKADGTYYALKPNYRGSLPTADSRFSATTDVNGFRGEKTKLADKNALVIGDSFVFGLGVDDDETFAACIAKKSAPSMGVVNAGVAGYNLSQYSARLAATFDLAKPSTVIVAIFANDWEDLDYTTYIADSTGNLVIAPESMRASDMIEGRLPPNPREVANRATNPIAQWLVARSRLAEIVHLKLIYRRMEKQSGPANETHGLWTRLGSLTRNLLTGRLSVGEERIFKRGVEIVVKMNAFARERGADFLVVYIPHHEELANREIAFLREALKAAMSQNNVPLLDLSERFSSEANSGRLYIPGDGHLSVEGNAVACEAIFARMSQQAAP